MRAICFLDRDGTLIVEPKDEQVDRLEKLRLVPGVLPALLRLKERGYRFVVVSNQDGLGTPSFPSEDYELVHHTFVDLFSSQGIDFDEVLICPHLPEEGCTCRKPHLGLLREFLVAGALDRERSCVIGDRESDIGLAENLGLRGYRLSRNGVAEGSGRVGESACTWSEIADDLLGLRRAGTYGRETSETNVQVKVVLDRPGSAQVDTGIGFFDHMLEQLARHGGFDLELRATGDLEVDSHHTVEDVGIALGTALRRALGDRTGLRRYGFSLPMDESSASALVDLSGRSLTVFKGDIGVEKVGAFATEMVPHFFRSFADALGATLHVTVRGQNAHHMIECAFKAVARALRPALGLESGAGQVPSTKGVL